MSYSKKLGHFILSLLLVPLSIAMWAFSVGTSWLFGSGLWLFCSMFNMFQDGRTSYFMKKNPDYGEQSMNSYTDTIKTNIYDRDGNSVGTYETEGAKHYYTTTDERKYVIKASLFIFYFIPFPIYRAISLVAEFLSLFTSRYYVSLKAPEDYDPVKYIRPLHCFFGIVAKRSYEQQRKIHDKQDEKIRKKEELAREKARMLELRKANEEEIKAKKIARRMRLDKCVGLILKFLGIIGGLVALFFILKAIFKF